MSNDHEPLRQKGVIAYTYGYKTQMILPRNPSLTATQADQPCNLLDVDELLQMLNKLTGYNFDRTEPNLETGLQILISGNHDVGKCYAWFRTAFAFTFNGGKTKSSVPSKFTPVLIAWYAGLPDITNCDDSLTTALTPGIDAVDQGDTVIRLVDGEQRIIEPARSHPRRIWDILANRVIPYEWHARTTRDIRLSLPEIKSPLGVNYIPGTEFPEPELPLPSFSEFKAQYRERARNWTYYGFQKCVAYTAISHSWSNKLRSDLLPVNKGTWPIPLPEDITLEAIRADLLSFTFPTDRLFRPGFWQIYSPPHEIEYCWLDILCLRQAWTTSKGALLTAAEPTIDYKKLETIRLEEWKIDVPTIGSIYRRSCDILMYMNGLGKSISLAENDWDSPYHWLNRAWTLQEYAPGGIVMWGNKPHDRPQSRVLNHLLLDLPVSLFSPFKFYSILDVYILVPNRRNRPEVFPLTKEITTQFLEKLYRTGRVISDTQIMHGFEIIRQINRMRRRHASNPIDKIAGIMFPLNSQGVMVQLPIYQPGEVLESAWKRMLACFLNHWRWEFSIFAPQPPNQLLPSWEGLTSVLGNSPEPDSWLTLPRELDSAFWANHGEKGPEYETALKNSLWTLPQWTFELPGSFDVYSSSPLEGSEPLVGLQPLKCQFEIATKGDGNIVRRIHILPELSRGIEEGLSVCVEGWYLSSEIIANLSNENGVYYIIPHLQSALWPIHYNEQRLSSDFLEELAYPSSIPFFFIVCGPMAIPGSGIDSWDGIKFKKLGFLGVLSQYCVPEDINWTVMKNDRMFRRTLPFWKLFDAAYPPSLIPIIEGIPYTTPKAMVAQYGTEKVYSLIY